MLPAKIAQNRKTSCGYAAWKGISEVSTRDIPLLVYAETTTKAEYLGKRFGKLGLGER